MPGFGQFLRASQQQSIQYRVLSLPTWISLVGYLFALAMTQTVYGAPFMDIRWVMLIALAVSSAADWILSGARWGYRARRNSEQILLIYLLATFGTVVYAENWIFSGMRWGSHAAMLVVFLLFLPQIIAPRQAPRILGLIKYLMAALLVLSWFRPFIEGIPDTGALYHGATGNANTMGHLAFITALLFLQGLFTSNLPRVRVFSGVLAVAAVITLWQTGARSSVLALTIGVLLLFHYYPRETQRLAVLGILLSGLIMISFPKVPGELAHFILKTPEDNTGKSFTPVSSRKPIWSAAYEGFKARPLVGWGFGADKKISRKWEIKLTAIGAVERDAVNDFFFMLEGCGIIGLGSYLLLICIVLAQRPIASQKSILRRFRRNQKVNPDAIALYHTHVAFFILPTCLLVLNQFDNSALSAGNLISVITWLCTGCAAILRNELD
jgi:O-antigen ligase